MLLNRLTQEYHSRFKMPKESLVVTPFPRRVLPQSLNLSSIKHVMFISPEAIVVDRNSCVGVFSQVSSHVKVPTIKYLPGSSPAAGARYVSVFLKGNILG